MHKLNTLEKIQYTIFAMFFIATLLLAGHYDYETFGGETEEQQDVYIICDVESYTANGDIVVRMPNGSLHMYSVNDAPLEMCEVCFHTKYQNNYATYEIVAIR